MTNNSDLADPILRWVYDESPSLGYPIVTIDNNSVEFVTTMPSGQTAPHRANGITRTTVPCIIFTHQPTGLTDPTLKGGRSVAEGFADFIVVFPRNGFERPANTAAAAVARLFPAGTRIGTITIMKPARALKGYDDGVHYRVPVRVTYRAGVS